MITERKPLNVKSGSSSDLVTELNSADGLTEIEIEQSPESKSPDTASFSRLTTEKLLIARAKQAIEEAE